jgi:hypothetical protein
LTEGQGSWSNAPAVWTAALAGERYRDNRVAVAERDGELIGIAMSGPPVAAAAACAKQLYVR